MQYIGLVLAVTPVMSGFYGLSGFYSIFRITGFRHQTNPNWTPVPG